jgi:basic membrane protein A
MVVGAIAVGIENGARWFGTQSSQAELAGESAVAFQIYKWEVILADMINHIQSGVLGGESYVLTLANGGLVMEFAG